MVAWYWLIAAVVLGLNLGFLLGVFFTAARRSIDSEFDEQLGEWRRRD